MSLIIVESPTKARTFNRLLKNKNYFVFATLGHIRDLPENQLAIDYKQNFRPCFQIIKNKNKIVEKLSELATNNQEIILATDPDREGESISYHVAYLLGFVEENWPEFKVKDKILKNNNLLSLKRIIFHEITEAALEEALNNPQTLRINLIKAQQTRRILDRIVGYELSPLLWKKIGKNWLSAGRVQTVALRLIVEREKEIQKFKKEEYYKIIATFISEKKRQSPEIKAQLIGKNDSFYEQKFTLKLFAGEYQYSKTSIDKKNLQEIKNDLLNDKFKIFAVKEEIQDRYPPPPFTTSILQQEAFQRFNFSSKQTMKLAQDLYEQGLITYHRTDSFLLSSSFVFAAKNYIKKNFGSEYTLEKPRGYKTKSKLAQEAHEAIRPTHLNKEINKNLTNKHRRLYQLIFERTIATQMKEAKVKVFKIFIKSEKGYYFETKREKIIFDGFFRLLNPSYVKNNNQDFFFEKNEEFILKNIEEKLNETKPPPRYHDGSLIKTLEEKGIGRPSTYAPIISLIQEKHYVEKINRYFIPTKLGEAISNYLSSGFPEIFDLNFTAKMEDGLDDIANNKKDMITLINEFFDPFVKQLQSKKNDDQKINIEEKVDEKCPKCNSSLVVRFSKFGKFLACSQYPKCDFTKSFINYIEGKNCPLCGGKIVVRYTQTKKKFYGCSNWPQCQWRSWKLIK